LKERNQSKNRSDIFIKFIGNKKKEEKENILQASLVEILSTTIRVSSASYLASYKP
jgi:hypothetical protein